MIVAGRQAEATRFLSQYVKRNTQFALLCALCITACSGGQSPGSGQDDFRQWKLPGALREISGLALTSDQRLLAITDEQAIVYELDYEKGEVVKTFAFGDPVLEGDFEGIAVLRGRVWLMTSSGDLYVAEEGADGERVSYEAFATGHGDYCELEGLAQITAVDSLLLVCKETNSTVDPLQAYEWSVRGDAVVFVRDLTLPEQEIALHIDKKRVNPSGAAVHPESGDWLMIAARQRGLFRTNAEGDLFEATKLPHKNRHRQAEGIEVTDDGLLLIADEGGSGKAKLTVYRLAPIMNFERD